MLGTDIGTYVADSRTAIGAVGALPTSVTNIGRAATDIGSDVLDSRSAPWMLTTSVTDIGRGDTDVGSDVTPPPNIGNRC